MRKLFCNQTSCDVTPCVLLVKCQRVGEIYREIYRISHKSLRKFRTRLRYNQDRHSRTEHINRQRISWKLAVSLPLLTCPRSAWPSQLPYRRDGHSGGTYELPCTVSSLYHRKATLLATRDQGHRSGFGIPSKGGQAKKIFTLIGQTDWLFQWPGLGVKESVCTVTSMIDKNICSIHDFKHSRCYVCCMLSSGWLTGVLIYIPTFRITLFHLHRRQMELTVFRNGI
jgi:hypothetical protein